MTIKVGNPLKDLSTPHKEAIKGAKAVTGKVKAEFANNVQHKKSQQALGRVAESQQAALANQAALDQAAGVKPVTGDAGIDRMLHNRPGYKGITDASGKVNQNYLIDKQASNLSGLDQRMSKAKDVAARSVDNQDVSAKSVQSGANFKSAQDNIKKLEGRAFGTGPSDWAKARMSLADSQNMEARNQLAQDSRRATTANMNAMAQQGGLEGGSRERMMQAASRDRMKSGQALARQNAQAKLGITADDEVQRMQLQSQLPGMNLQTDAYSTGLQTQNANRDFDAQRFNSGQDLQAKQFNSQQNMTAQQFNSDKAMKQANMWGNMADQEAGRNQQVEIGNTQNAIGDNQAKNASDLDSWNVGMDAYSAVRTANAQAAAADKQNKPWWKL